MERNIISIDEYGKVALPTNIQTTAICKSGVLNEYEIKHTIRLSDKCSIEVYSLETIIALAFRIGTYRTKQVRNAVFERLYLRKEKTSFFFSLNTNGIAKA